MLIFFCHRFLLIESFVLTKGKINSYAWCLQFSTNYQLIPGRGGVAKVETVCYLNPTSHIKSGWYFTKCYGHKDK